MIPQIKPYLDNSEIEAVTDVLSSEWLTEGKYCQAFQKKLNNLIDCEYGVFAPNGTLGLYLALLAMDIGPGDEVIVPDTTFIASANAVLLTGATVQLVDVNSINFQLDPQACKVNSYTKAIMPVHLYGSMANMPDIMTFAKKNDLIVIEDACQAIGVKMNQRHAGTFGDIGVFSFFADKTITTGEGAYVVCNNEKIYNRLLTLRNQGRIKSGSFYHPEFGVNFRITDLQAAVGSAQMDKLEFFITRKTQRLNWYRELLCEVKEISFFKPNLKANFVPFRVVVFCEKAKQLTEYLETKDIQTRRVFYPLHRQPSLSGSLGKFSKDSFVNSNRAYDTGLCLPIYADLQIDEIEYICEQIKDFF